MLKVGQEKCGGSTNGRGAGFAATKSFIKNHERHERARNFKPQNTLNTLKKPRRRADKLRKSCFAKRKSNSK
jgi:hypothetical protein